MEVERLESGLLDLLKMDLEGLTGGTAGLGMLGMPSFGLPASAASPGMPTSSARDGAGMPGPPAGAGAGAGAGSAAAAAAASFGAAGAAVQQRGGRGEEAHLGGGGRHGGGSRAAGGGGGGAGAGGDEELEPLYGLVRSGSLSSRGLAALLGNPGGDVSRATAAAWLYACSD